MSDFVAYHDWTSADHVKEINKYYPLGFRHVSLSVYGSPSDPRYAGIMIKRTLPVEQVEVHDLTAAQWQATFNAQAAKGFGPVILTATGTAANPLFAAVFEPRSTIPMTRHGLDRPTFEATNAQARQHDLVLSWAGIYGTADDPRYLGIWQPNTGKVVWNVDGDLDTATDYQLRFNAQSSGFGYPSLVTLSGDQRYLSIFADREIGPWIARHGMTHDGYQQEFDTWVKNGYFPIYVQGGGEGSAARFAALFVKNEILPRQWSVTGSPAVAAIDQAMETIMKQYGVRGAALAITQGTRLVLARGYTWAESGYPLVQPTTCFRVASCSKTITAVAIYQLIAAGKLHLSDTVQSILQLKTPSHGDPVDPRFKTVTIQQLLEHRSGVARDYTWEDPQIVSVFHTQLPATQEQTGSYMMTKLLDFTPGSQQVYSNFGYWLLGQVAAKLRGQQFFADVAKEYIFTPLHSQRIRSSRSLAAAQLPDEARYHSPDLVLHTSVMTPDQPLVPREYGDENLEKAVASGAFSAAATDYARFLAAFNVQGNNPMLSPAEIQSMFKAAAAGGGHGFDSMAHLADGTWQGQKGGLLQTSQDSFDFSSGISFFVAWNTEGVGGDWYPWFPEVVSAAKAHTWPATDLFPQYGMPSF